MRRGAFGTSPEECDASKRQMDSPAPAFGNVTRAIAAYVAPTTWRQLAGRRRTRAELPYVSFTQVELDSRLHCAHSSLREHRRRRVKPYYTPAGCLSNRDRNAPCAYCKLDQWPVSITGKSDGERDVSIDASGPVPVSVRQGVVPARHGNTNLRGHEAAFGCASVQE
jgi:hypothetical protein